MLNGKWWCVLRIINSMGLVFCRIAQPQCNALTAIHDRGVLHGDVLPRNLMVQRSPVCTAYY
jgi:tRNA A-37 threonylcarbamoyl transferase component Bud32